MSSKLCQTCRHRQRVHNPKGGCVVRECGCAKWADPYAPQRGAQPYSVGDLVRLRDGVIFGPLYTLTVTRAHKNGNVEATHTDALGRGTWVKVHHSDVFAFAPTAKEAGDGR